MALKIFFAVAGILLLFQLQNNFAYSSYIEDNRHINDFFNYYDVTKNINVDKHLKEYKAYVKQLHDSVPIEDRGSTSALLRNYVDDLDRVKTLGMEAIELKSKTLTDLELLIVRLQNHLAKNENEDSIIGIGLIGLFDLSSKVAQEDSRFVNKITRAIYTLIDNVSDEAQRRYDRIFNLLRDFENQDDVRRKEWFTQLKMLRAEFKEQRW